MIRVDRNTFKLESSGYQFSANRGLLSIGDDGAIYNGYDGDVRRYDDDYEEIPFTQAERREIADHVIACWQQWAAEPSARAGEK